MKKHLRFVTTNLFFFVLSSTFFSLLAKAGTPGNPPDGRPTATEKFIKVNLFGGTNPYNNAEWNNWDATASRTVTALKYADATVSSVQAVLSASTVVDNNSTYTTTGTLMAPQEVLRYTSYAGTRTLTLSGLSANKTYNLELYASRNNTGSGNSTIFSAGGSSITISTDKNFTNKAVFTGLVPNTSGQIVLNMTKVSTYTYLNGFILTEVSNDPLPNQLPTANAGSDQTLTLPTNFTSLTGSGTDPDGTIASYAWSQVTGPNNATLGSATASTTTLSDLVQGTYVFRLTVTDNAGATATDDISVTVNAAGNQAPTANAGADQTISLPTNSAILSGSGTDADGTISSYAWSQVSGPGTATLTNANTTTATASDLVQGSYIFRLTVTDNAGATASDEVTITVNADSNQAPTANAGADQTITLPNNSASLSGSGTTPQGTITDYNWSQVSGPTTAAITSPTAASTTITGLEQGTYVFRLTVTNNKGATATDDVSVTVNAAGNQPPTANAGADQTITLPVNTATLTGSGTDADGTIASYAWSQVSGPSTATLTNANTATAGAADMVQGTYIFRLTVTDNGGSTATDDVSVTVNPAPNQPPTVNAGTDQTLILPVNSTTLTGSASDADGTIATYAWSQVSGPGTATIGSAATASTTISNLVQGTYVFKLTVTDNAGGSNFDEVTVIVNPANNQPPTANAGADQSITLPTSSTTLTGSGTDADGTIASYAWTKVSGPTGGTITTPAAATTTVTSLQQGTYVFRLTVTDNKGATATDDINVVVNAANQPPTANAGADQTITLPTSSTTLTGSGTDADGTIASYAWTKVSGPTGGTITTPAAATTTVTSLQQGTYVFRLTVTDNKGATATDDINVVVNAANQPPTANAGADQSITLPTSSTTLTGSGTDADGTIASYAWTKVSGPTGGTITTPAAATTTVTSLQQGTYVFRLTVTDNKGATATDDINVVVNAANQPPTANAGADQSITLPTSSTTLTGSGTDADGTIASYAWTKVSGPTGGTITTPAAASTTVTSLQQGTYVFRLTVTDNKGATATDDINVVVNAANQPPTANAGADQTITLPTSSTTLTGSGTDADGTIASYAWTKVSGPTGGTITTPAAATTTVTSLQQGTYVFRLTVTDNKGATATDDINVVVNAANQPPTANAGADQSITLPTSSTTLTGSGTDADGTIASYAWTKVSGPTGGTITTPAAATTTVTSLQQGTYVFRLTVTDNKGATATDDINVVVNAAVNQSPVANAGLDKSITLPTNSTSLSGSGSDPDGTIAAYAWTQVSGPGTATLTNANTTTVTVSNLVQGTYVFRLTVTDNAGAKGSDDVNVTVNGTTVVKLGVFNPNDPVVTYDPAKPPVKPATGQVGKWVRTVRVSWNSTAYKCYIYNNMAFRLKFPKNYDSTRSYPLLVFLHGLGEYGTIYDNEYQLYLGGQTHASAVDGGKFDGFLLYPQSTTEQWSSGNITNIYNLLEKVMIAQNMVDPFRVYFNGLSAGANNVWLFLRKYSKLVAAGTPISSASSSMIDSVQKYKYTPIYHFQGGLDSSPTPGAARSLGNNILKVGGNYTYKEFPDRGHACWYQSWAEPDYFPFYARAHKANPWPLYGRTEFCAGETIRDTLGVTPGFEGYEWRRNGVLIPGATSNYIVATSYGTYDCRIKRGTVWSPWSPTPVVIKEKAPTVQPTITTTGLVSNVIPAPDGRTTVPLEVPEGYQSYLWQKEGSTTTLSTTRFLTASSAGSYKVKVTEQYGCSASSLGFSAPFLVVNASGSNGPDAPSGLAATAVSKTAIKLTWSQTASPAYNETGFEVYEATASGGPYKYRGRTAADATTITYSDLNTGTAYFYKVRAVNNNAASAVVGPASATTQTDNIVPTTPTSLRLGTITKSSVELLWNASTDDIGVAYYDVYINGVKTYAVLGTLTKATMYNLIASKDYTFMLRARDAAGNLSAASNQVTARTLTGTNTQDPTMSPANAANFSVYINMNVDNPAGAPWNNTNSLPTEGLVFSNLKNYSANISGVSMKIVDNFTGYNAGGMNTGNNSGVYPDNVMRSAFYNDKGQVTKIQISGLSLNHKYSFVFFGSRSGTGDRTSVYKIGTQSVSLNASNNTTTTVQIDNVVPDQNGTVTYTVSLGATALYAYQNSLVIKGYANTTTAAATAANLTAATAEEQVQQDSAATVQVQAYPNPVDNDVLLSAPLHKAVPELVVQVYEPSGTMLSTRRFANVPKGLWQQRIPLTGRSGLYFVRISGLPDGRNQTIRLIKRK